MVKPKVVQVWVCPRCGTTQEVFVPARFAQCAARHKPLLMRLAEGEPLEHPPSAKPRSVRSRPKAGLVSTVDELFDIVTGKETDSHE